MTDNEYNPEDLERVARFLDGQKIELTLRQRQLACEIQQDQQALAGEMDQLEIPRGTMDTARRRVRAAALAPTHRVVRMLSWATAAAAILLVALWVMQYTQKNYGPHQQLAQNQPNTPAANPISPEVDTVADSASDKAAVVALMTIDTDDLDAAIDQTDLGKVLGGQ